jgi:hypothetical protein
MATSKCTTHALHTHSIILHPYWIPSKATHHFFGAQLDTGVIVVSTRVVTTGNFAAGVRLTPLGRLEIT